MVKSDRSDAGTKGLYVITIGVDPDTADGIRQCTLQENGIFAGEVAGYSPRQGQLQPLLETRPSGALVFVIDFDKDSKLAVQTAGSLSLMFGGRAAIMAVSEKSDPTLILEAMRAGCCEYLCKPLVAGEVCKALTRVSSRRL